MIKTRILTLAAIALLSLAATAKAAPYMGVDTWYSYGLNVNEQKIVSLTDATVSRGLAADGYRYVWLDAGWWKAADGPGTPGTRNPDGSIQLDPSLWPHGMRWLTDYIHSKGLLAGIYTDAGPVGCGNGGSWGHYQQDADTFAAWGFDAVKMDYCGGGRTGLTPEQNFSAFSAALKATGRPMLFNVCDAMHPNGDPGDWLTNWQFGPGVSNSWRTGPDIGWPGTVPWTNVLRNLYLDAAHPAAESPGHYNDPDYLAPGMSKTYAESRAQVTMWAMESAPLMASVDVATLPTSLLDLLTNPEVLAIDRSDVQALQVRPGVWVKAERHGMDVAFLNSSAVPERFRYVVRGLGRHLSVRDPWRRYTRLQATRVVTATVGANSAYVVHVTRGRL
jgi:alpha-galactosidase